MIRAFIWRKRGRFGAGRRCRSALRALQTPRKPALPLYRVEGRDQFIPRRYNAQSELFAEVTGEENPQTMDFNLERVDKSAGVTKSKLKTSPSIQGHSAARPRETSMAMAESVAPSTRYPPPATRYPAANQHADNCHADSTPQPAPPATRHPPPATRHPPPATRHPPPATRHPPPATRYPPPDCELGRRTALAEPVAPSASGRQNRTRTFDLKAASPWFAIQPTRKTSP